MTSNPSGPAAAEGVSAPPPTRRAVLIGGAATALVVAPAALAAAGRPLTSWMDLKIAAHREAAEAESRLDRELDVADERFGAAMRGDPVLVVLEDEHGQPKTMDLGENGCDGVETAIKAIFRASMEFPLTGFYGPSNLDRIAATVDVARDRHARNLAAYKAVCAEESARLARFGIVELQERGRALHKRENAALAALLAERPRTIEDVEARMRYLAEADLLPVLSKDHTAILLRSMTGGVP